MPASHHLFHTLAMVKTRKGDYKTSSLSNKKTTTKVKDKVGSPEARAARGLSAKAEIPSTTLQYSSDEFNYSDEDDSASLKSTAASDTSQVSEGSRSNLKPYLLSILLRDVISAGGIDRFHLVSSQALATLCDKRPEIYGPRGSKLRERIRKKIFRWKLLQSKSEDKWLALLVKHNISVKPRKAQQEVAAEPTGKDDRKPVLVVSPVFSTFPSQIPTVINTSISAVTKMAFSENTRKCSSPCFLSLPSGNVTLHAHLCIPEVIAANPDRPECNGPFLLYRVPDFSGAEAGTEHKGFYMILPIDMRYVDIDDEINWFGGNVSGSQHLLFRVPSFPYPLYPWLKNGDGFYKCIQEQVPFSVQKAMNDAHSPFDPSFETTETAMTVSRQWKYILMDFSSVKDVGELSSKVLFDGAGEKELLDYDLIKIPVLWDSATSKATHWEYMLGFKVGSIDGGKSGRKVARKGAQKSRLANKLASTVTGSTQGDSMKME